MNSIEMRFLACQYTPEATTLLTRFSRHETTRAAGGGPGFKKTQLSSMALVSCRHTRRRWCYLLNQSTTCLEAAQRASSSCLSKFAPRSHSRSPQKRAKFAHSSVSSRSCLLLSLPLALSLSPPLSLVSLSFLLGKEDRRRVSHPSMTDDQTINGSTAGSWASMPPKPAQTRRQSPAVFCVCVFRSIFSFISCRSVSFGRPSVRLFVVSSIRSSIRSFRSSIHPSDFSRPQGQQTQATHQRRCFGVTNEMKVKAASQNTKQGGRADKKASRLKRRREGREKKRAERCQLDGAVSGRPFATCFFFARWMDAGNIPRSLSLLYAGRAVLNNNGEKAGRTVKPEDLAVFTRGTTDCDLPCRQVDIAYEPKPYWHPHLTRI